jgi:hypothetical protein
MVSRRRVILSLMLVSLLATGTFALLALVHAPGTTVEPRPLAGSQASDPTATGDERARAGIVESQQTGSALLQIVFAAAAFVSACVLIVTTFVARREVRTEKRRMRVARVKRAVADDLREFRRNRQVEPRQHT